MHWERRRIHLSLGSAALIEWTETDLQDVALAIPAGVSTKAGMANVFLANARMTTLASMQRKGAPQ
jgi:hypothetical protein